MSFVHNGQSVVTSLGQSNEAFEVSEEDNVVPYPREAVQKGAFNLPEDSIQDGSKGCRLFGLIALPEIFSKLFLNAAWILIFLSWASTIQVRFLKKNKKIKSWLLCSSLVRRGTTPPKTWILLLKKCKIAPLIFIRPMLHPLF